MTYIIPIGIGVAALITGLIIVAWLIDLRHEAEGAAMFGTNGRHATQPPAVTAPPEPAPFPGDEPAEPAPAAAPPAYVVDEIGHDGDTEAWLISAWDRIQSRELNERLRAEEAEEALS